MQTNEEEIASLKSQMADVKEEIAHLNKTVFLGNGTPSLISQVSEMRAKIGTMAKLLWIVVGGIVTIILQNIIHI